MKDNCPRFFILSFTELKNGLEAFENVVGKKAESRSFCESNRKFEESAKTSWQVTGDFYNAGRSRQLELIMDFINILENTSPKWILFI